jgi:hypothetical protein
MIWCCVQMLAARYLGERRVNMHTISQAMANLTGAKKGGHKPQRAIRSYDTQNTSPTARDMHRPNENKLSHRWLGRAWIAMGVSS